MPLTYALVALALAPAESPIKRDEVVVFFPTYGRRVPDEATWELEVRGWIYEPETDSEIRGEALELFRRGLGLSPESARAERFERRARLFLVDNERGKRVPVRLGEKVYTPGESGADGHFRGTIRLSDEEARSLLRARKGKDRWLPYQAVTRAGDGREFCGEVHLIGETGLSVISDVDDTIKVTAVNNPAALVANTFLRDFRAVPGMADVYRKWAGAGAAFHYVSESPWQLYPPLAEWRDRAALPKGTFHLRSFRWKDERFLNLFASPEETKPRSLEPILRAFPRRRFVLVGDAGQKDPEIYGELARKYPGQVVRIAIRDPTGEGADTERYRKAFRDIPPERWQVFRDPDDLRPLPKAE